MIPSIQIQLSASSCSLQHECQVNISNIFPPSKLRSTHTILSPKVIYGTGCGMHHHQPEQLKIGTKNYCCTGGWSKTNGQVPA
jgi:hypothetical protein